MKIDENNVWLMWQLETQSFASLFLTSVHFRGELQYVGDVSEQKNEELTNKFLKFLSDKIFVATLRNFRHFCPTKNIAQYFFSVFEISN